MTASELLDLEGVSKAFSREIVEAATRVNYAQAGAFLTLPSSYLRDENNQQNLDKIHALEGLISMASSGAYSVKGGNYQIFEEFIKRSGATINLNTEVRTRPSPRFEIFLKSSQLGGETNQRP
jgi:prenylcysteine oxidase/farnesylcysteine lyase